MKPTTKRNVSILAAVALSASVIVGGTLAYFYDKEEITNPFSTSKDGISITLEEPNYDAESSKDMTPGKTITKDPTITNEEGEAYARFVVTLKDKETGEVITDAARADKIMSTVFFDKMFAEGATGALTAGNSYSQAELTALLGDNFSTPTNSKFALDATRSSAGIYYFNYSDKLAKGEKTTLFTHVAIPSDWGQADIEVIKDFDLVVMGQAIQTSNIDNAADAFDFLDEELSNQ